MRLERTGPKWRKTSPRCSTNSLTFFTWFSSAPRGQGGQPFAPPLNDPSGPACWQTELRPHPVGRVLDRCRHSGNLLSTEGPVEPQRIRIRVDMQYLDAGLIRLEHGLPDQLGSDALAHSARFHEQRDQLPRGGGWINLSEPDHIPIDFGDECRPGGDGFWPRGQISPPAIDLGLRVAPVRLCFKGDSIQGRNVARQCRSDVHVRSNE